MKFGVCIPNYGEFLDVATLREVATEAENLGYESIWTTDHILMPKHSKTPYERIIDSICTLAYLASHTKRIKLGISSLIIAMRNPVVVAKQLATVDVLCGGRLIVAIGTGWNAEEFSFLGSNFHTRGERVNESIRLLRQLWSGDARKFEGARMGIKFEDATFEPRPSSGALTIWVGGASKAAMIRAATLGDAWHPNAFPLDDFKKMVDEFRNSSPAAKDRPICVRIGINVSATQSEYRGPQGERRIMLSGNMNENVRIISELDSIGVSQALLVTSPNGRVSKDKQLKSLVEFAKEFL